MAYAHMFYGDNRRSENPRDFLCDFEEHLASLPDVSESRKCEHFSLHCRSGFYAEEWYENFEQNSPSVITSWSTLRKHFCVKWLGAAPDLLLEKPKAKLVITTQLGAATIPSRETNPTTTIPAPYNTTANAIYKTAMPAQLDCVVDACHVIALPMPITNQLALETITSTTTTDSNNTIMAITQQDNEKPGVGSEEEERRVEKQDRTGEREADRCKAEEGEQEGIETQSEPAPRDEIVDPVRMTSANAVPCSTTAIQLIQPTPSPSQLVRATPKPTITPSKGDMAPHACTRAMGMPSDRNTAASMPINGIPVDLDPGNMTDTICIAFASAVPVDPDPSDVATNTAGVILATHIVHV